MKGTEDYLKYIIGDSSEKPPTRRVSKATNSTEEYAELKHPVPQERRVREEGYTEATGRTEDGE